jgi:hypothetical protein
MWRRDLVWTDVSEERIAFIFRVEKSASEEPALSMWQQMEAIRSSETSVHTRSPLRHIQEDGKLQPSCSVMVRLTRLTTPQTTYIAWSSRMIKQIINYGCGSKKLEVVTIGFWRWCITFRDIGFSDFIHRPGIKNKLRKNTTFQKLDLFPSSGEGKNHWSSDWG